MKITQAQFIALLDSAHNAGEDVVRRMLDNYPCGGAYVTLDGNSELYKAFKKYGTKTGDGFNAEYSFNGWAMTKDYPKGFSLSNRNPKKGFQNMHANAARVNAYVQKFGEHDFVTSSRTYID